jgi:mannitol-1-phosphate 5-dehydrogenase
LPSFQALNTVIGKMSGVITDEHSIRRLKLAPLTPRFNRAVLVEEFNRILISRVRLPGFRRGIEVFQEKGDLLPFEEAKLYGHNAIHALIAYLADNAGYATIAEAGGDERLMAVARRAFLDECGPALIRQHAALGDELFTPAGWRAYAEDLLARMVNPHLSDRVDRVGRDHLRKLSWDDRLYGAMRRALSAGVEPVNLARGAAAAILSLIRRQHDLRERPAGVPLRAGDLTPDALEKLLLSIWGRPGDAEARRLIALTAAALGPLPGQGNGSLTAGIPDQ